MLVTVEHLKLFLHPEKQRAVQEKLESKQETDAVKPMGAVFSLSCTSTNIHCISCNYTTTRHLQGATFCALPSATHAHTVF